MCGMWVTSLCAEYSYPQVFHLEQDGLDYVGFELEKGIIEVGTAGKVDKISKNQDAQIFINNKKFKRGFLDKLLGR